MRRISSISIIALLSLSTPALAGAPSVPTGASTVTAHLVSEALSVSPPLAPTVDEQPQLERAPVGEVQLGEVVKLLGQAVSSRSWGLLACALVLGSVYLVRRFGVSRMPWMRSDAGGIALAVATAAAVQLSAAIAAGKPITVSLVLSILVTAAGASGLFSWGTKLKAAHQYAKRTARTR